MSPLRIVVVVRKLALGGAERQACMLAAGFLARHGAAVELLAFTGGEGVPRVLDGRVPIHLADPGSGGSYVRRTLQLLRFVRVLRSLHPDVLLPFTDFPNRVVGATWRLTGARCCVWNQRDEGREHTRRPMESLALAQVPFFVANSEVGRAHLIDTFGVSPQLIEVIHNGVRPDPPGAPREVWRRRLGVNEGQLVATMIAHVHRFKDHHTLMSAWAQVVAAAERPPLLVLAGQKGDTASSLEAVIGELGIDEHVRFLGIVDDVSGLYEASDLAVFSSRTEGCPNAVLEAMAAGLPVVATSIVGTREALGDTAPHLVPAGDAAQLARVVLRLLASPEERRAHGEANRRRVLREFPPAKAVDAYWQLLQRLLPQQAS